MDLTQLSADALLDGLAARRFSAAELMEATLARIAAVNGEINAIVALRDPDDLLREAQTKDAAGPGGPLHGLPMAVKDLVQVAGVRTTFGSPLFADHVPRHDDLLARRLREAGAILFGKTNVPEWGLGSHTFNPVHGTTANPHDPSRTAGGSSGGAAAALAANMVALADGSDMMGSLRNPAAFCGVLGFRPTWGTVPNDTGGRIAGDTAMHQLSTDGPMARDAKGLALLLGVLAQPDGRFPFARTAPPRFSRDLRPDAKVRIGWLGDWQAHYAMEDGILAAGEDALGRMAGAGARVEPVVPDFDPDAVWRAWLALRAFATLGRLGPFHADPAKRAMLKPEAIWEVEEALRLTPADIHTASVVRSRFFACVADLWERFDVLALPSAQVWPFPKEWRHPTEIAGRTMDTYHRWMEVVVPVSLLGLPAVSVPVDTGGGLPMGVQLFAPRGEDQRLLNLAAAWDEMRA